MGVLTGSVFTAEAKKANKGFKPFTAKAQKANKGKNPYPFIRLIRLRGGQGV